ncbi:putative Ribosomal RNA-processing protein 1 [Seiridium cardinale]|uniref:Ribosomal RNA-processing protein 1 n=1 Tax=Seiridium cardinale TaxID=138064 RepID=A0ABR2Y1N7_9PEZI
MAAEERSMPFIKNLASSDRKARDKALDTLRTFLTASTTARSLSPLENLKLWKGLFYSMYMCDRPIPQQNLCNELASLLDILPDEAVIPWLAGFWDVMSREWTGIDVLRMEKFLLLVRRVLGRSLLWVHDGKGKKGDKRKQDMLGLFIDWPFETTGDLKKVPVGLRLHVLDIWIDEAEKVGLVGEGVTEENVEWLVDLKGILDEVIKNTVTPIKSKAKESVADERLPWNVAEEGEGSDEDEDEEMSEAGEDQEDGWGGFKD